MGVRVVAIVQARMDSTRLPGKVLRPLAGRPILWHIVDRLSRSEKLVDIIIATTTFDKDDVIHEFARRLAIGCFRGTPPDPLSRHYGAAKQARADVVVRIPADKPLVDPKIVDDIVKQHFRLGADYTSNWPFSTYPEGHTFPRGLEVEVFAFDALEKAWRGACRPYEREHVTPFIYQHQSMFDVQVVNATGWLRRPDLRLTLDTPEDLQVIQLIYDSLYREGEVFDSRSVIEFLDANPALAKMNVHVRQKGIGE